MSTLAISQTTSGLREMHGRGWNPSSDVRLHPSTLEALLNLLDRNTNCLQIKKSKMSVYFRNLLSSRITVI